MSDDERFDGLLLTIAQQHQGIDALLGTFFGFLRRKTDFFTGADASAVENAVLSQCRQQMALVKKPKAESSAALVKKAKIEEVSERQAARIVAEERQKQEDAKKKLEAKKKQEQQQQKKKAAAAAAAAATAGDDGDSDSDGEQRPKEGHVRPSVHAGGEWFGELEGGGGERSEQPVYAWSQTLAEVDVRVAVPKGTRAKQLKIDMRQSSLSVALDGRVLFAGDLFADVELDECAWTLEDREIVHIILQKSNNMQWWSCVVRGHVPPIDTALVVPETSKLSDLDGETRATVSKMMYDQQMKARQEAGEDVLTSDEQQKKKLLEQFMKQHPEMDFSQAKFN